MSRNAPISDEQWTRVGRRVAFDAPVQEVKGTLKVERAPGDSDAMHLARVVEVTQQRQRLASLAAWSHKNEGTSETHAYAARTRQGALARLHLAGSISADELAWACEIAMAAESIERDVEVRVASLETRVDHSGSAKNALVEGIIRVRREVAYTHWRKWIPMPKRAVLDMIVGDPISYTRVAKQYRMRKERAKKLLIDAINLWPAAMDVAEKEVDTATLAAAHAAIL